MTDSGDTLDGEVFETRGRLSVADTDSGTVAVWDLDVGMEVQRYDLGAPALLHRPLNRQITAVIAAQPTIGRFDVLGVGVWIWDHVDHFHVYKESAAFQIDSELEMVGGLTEIGVTGGWVIAFDDATGRGTALFERSIGNLRTDVDRTRAPVFRDFATEPHDGTALISRGNLFVTQAGGGVARATQGPTGFGMPQPLMEECLDAGTATGASIYAVYACRDGYLTSTWDEDAGAFEYSRIAHPDGAAAATWLFGEDDLPHIVGRVSARDLVLIDVPGGTAEVVALEEDIAEVTADRDGQHLLVLTTSGMLLDLDPSTGMERRRLEGAGAGPISTGDGFVYVADPATQTVREVDLENFAEVRQLDVGMTIGSLVVTALWPGGEPVMH
ncbi:MAG: hypothetical protein AAGF12_19395 [Myxococcota bacterium]